MFKVLRIYSAKHGGYMWYVKRVKEECGKDDYYGAFITRDDAEDKKKELTA